MSENKLVSARVIADSISPNGVRLTTMELEYPRIIHAEFLTHRCFARNAASSRAIPFSKMLDQLGARPIRFGQANPGMQDKGVDYDALVDVSIFEGNPIKVPALEAWEAAESNAVDMARAFYEAGFHKQILNRLLEPFQFIKVVVSATEWENFFWLRCDEAADPTIAALANEMRAAYNASVPLSLTYGELHVPYVHRRIGKGDDVSMHYFEDAECTVELSKHEALVVSAARCAAVSFRNTDYNLEKSQQVFDRLVSDQRIHGSALEHQAAPIECAVTDIYKFKWPEGVSHVDKRGRLWSGNFRGWIQYRKTIPGENHE